MSQWQRILKKAITSPLDLPASLRPTECGSDVPNQYPMRINPYYLSLIKEKGDPLWLQAVPQAAELNDQVCMTDPLAEVAQPPK